MKYFKIERIEGNDFFAVDYENEEYTRIIHYQHIHSLQVVDTLPDEEITDDWALAAPCTQEEFFYGYSQVLLHLRMALLPDEYACIACDHQLRMHDAFFCPDCGMIDTYYVKPEDRTQSPDAPAF